MQLQELIAETTVNSHDASVCWMRAYVGRILVGCVDSVSVGPSWFMQDVHSPGGNCCTPSWKVNLGRVAVGTWRASVRIVVLLLLWSEGAQRVHVVAKRVGKREEGRVSTGLGGLWKSGFLRSWWGLWLVVLWHFTLLT